VLQVFSRCPSAFASPRLYQLLNIYNPATIDRFHMTTQTTLSAAAPAPQEEPRLLWHRHSCLPRGTRGLCTVARPRTQVSEAAASLPSKFLIANDNPTRIVILSDQRVSKGLRSQSLLVLMANLELEFNLSHRKLSPLQIPNRKFLAIFESLLTAVRSSPPSSSRTTDHSPLITDPNLSNLRYRD
jgi:hypothetical protein